MATLRDMVDGKTLATMRAQTAPKTIKQASDEQDDDEDEGSPAAQHVGRHVQDPYNETKDGVDELNQKRMDYEVAKNKMRMQLKPVENVVQGIKNMHQLDGPGDGSPLDMSPNDPNKIAMNDPNMGMGMDPSGQQIDDQTGLPMNMTQTPGQMNQNRPSQVGFQPGVSPGPQESVRPGKMGTPQPGMGNPSTAAGNPGARMPMGWQKPGQGPTNNQATYNQGAAPPKGAGSMPGAKGPGDPKVANRTKQAQNNSAKKTEGGRAVKVEVHADNMMMKPAQSNVVTHAMNDKLRAGSSVTLKPTGRDRRGPDDFISKYATARKKSHALEAKRLTAMRSGPGGVMKAKKLKAYGTSEGVQKEWESRGRGAGALRKEKAERGTLGGLKPKRSYGEQPIDPNTRKAKA